ncbi:MAG: FumA C-terminus/TtdB family hydratase beta subunit [Candidatus Bathyarchaeia archaeon]
MHLHTPIKAEESKALRVGDIVYFSGEVVFCRDKAHERLCEFVHRQIPIPISIKGIPIYHAGPVVKKMGNSWKIIAAGPTTSARMEEYEAEIIRQYEPRIIIGKGGMGKKTLDALIEVGGAYAVFPGGAALLAASHMREVLGVYWLDLGIPDALWHVAVGPCIVTMDSKGESLHENINSKSLSQLKMLLSS